MLNKKQRKELNDIFTKSPKLTDREIGRKTKLSPVTIGKHRKEFWTLLDREFIDHGIKKSIFEMRRSVEHWKLLIDANYKILETNSKKLTAVVMEDGKKKIIGADVELSPDEKRNLLHEIAELEVKIQEFGNDPEINQLLTIMHDDKFQTN